MMHNNINNHEYAVEIINLSKVYRTYDRKLNRLKEYLSLGKRIYHHKFWALKNINLNIHKSEVCGIVGMNGAGKSTLLKILTGTTMPTTGEIKLKGRVASLLELGIGFHADLSGRENVLTNSKLLGLNFDNIKSRIEEIKEFSELGEFFDMPVRVYSSGMYIRLAFSLAVCVDPEILIIDEALSVGDAYFQQKCLDKIKDFKRKGITILFVSHDLGTVKLLCDRAILLHKGELIADDIPEKCLQVYNAILAQHENSVNKNYRITQYKSDDKQTGLSYGNYKAYIIDVKLLDKENNPISAIIAGHSCKVVLDIKFNEDIVSPTIGILIRDKLGYDVFGTNTTRMGIDTGIFYKGDIIRCIYDMDLNLGEGIYTLSPSIHSSASHVAECYHWIDRALIFNVLQRADIGTVGVSLLFPKVIISKITS